VLELDGEQLNLSGHGVRRDLELTADVGQELPFFGDRLQIPGVHGGESQRGGRFGVLLAAGAVPTLAPASSSVVRCQHAFQILLRSSRI